MPDNLKSFQNLFQNFLFKGENQLESALSFGSFSTKISLDIYREDYQARMISTLEKQYPRLLNLMGSEFIELAKVYIKHVPSETYDLGTFGRNLSASIENQELKDFAALESLVMELMERPAVNTFSPPLSLTGQEIFDFGESIRGFYSSTPVLSMWDKAENEPPKEHSLFFLIIRKPHGIQFKELGPFGFKLWEKLSRGLTINEIIVTDGDWNEEEVTYFFSEIVAKGLAKCFERHSLND